MSPPRTTRSHRDAFTLPEVADAFRVTAAAARYWAAEGHVTVEPPPPGFHDRRVRTVVPRSEVDRFARSRGVVVDLPDGTQAGDVSAAHAQDAADRMRPFTPDERRRLRSMLRL